MIEHKIELHEDTVIELLATRGIHEQSGRDYTNWDLNSMLNEAIEQFIEKHKAEQTTKR